jgi:transposase-like protein
MKYKKQKQENYKKVSCPQCKSKGVVKRGTFETKAHGKQQRYFCKSCNKKFIERTPFYRMRNNPKKITLCLDLFYKGVSTRQVQEHLQQFYPHNSSWVTIYNWIIKYSKQISKFTDKLKIKCGKELQIDEMEIGKRTSRHNGWYIDSIDSETRFMVASEFTKRRDLKEVKQVLSLAKKKTETQIKVVTSDGWLAYPKAIQKTFTLKHKSNTKKFGVIHNQVNASKGEGFNIKIERLHNSVRHRIKTMRGFHGSVDSANTIMKGYEIFYNFIRKHQAIKCTPSELATDIKLNGNKWLDLIHLSNQSI